MVAVDRMVLRMVLDFADVVAGCAQDRGRGGGHGAHAGFVGEERVLVGGYSAGHEGLCEVLVRLVRLVMLVQGLVQGLVRAQPCTRKLPAPAKRQPSDKRRK